jgi:hypothetical protein
MPDRQAEFATKSLRDNYNRAFIQTIVCTNTELQGTMA